jgi:hypothetical protein
MKKHTISITAIGVPLELAARAFLLKLHKPGRKKNAQDTAESFLVAGLALSENWNPAQIQGIQDRASKQDRRFFETLGMALNKGRSQGVFSLIEHFLLMHWKECPGGLPGLESWSPAAAVALLEAQKLLTPEQWPDAEKEFRRTRDGVGLVSVKPYRVTKCWLEKGKPFVELNDGKRP